MATATLLTSDSDGWDTAADTNKVSASITPGTNCLLVLLMGGIDNDVPGTPGIFATGSPSHTVVSSGSGPTWTKLAFGSAATDFDSCTCIWSAEIGGTSPGSFTVTMDWTSNHNAGEIVWGIYRVTGYDTTTPTAGVIANSRVAGTGNGAQTITLGATPTTNDIVLALSTCDTGAASDAVFDNTARTWTRDATGGTSGHQIGFAIGQSTGSTSTTVAWSDVNEDDGNNFTSAQCAVIAKAGAVGNSGSPTLDPFTSSASGTVTAPPPPLIAPTIVTPPPTAVVATY